MMKKNALGRGLDALMPEIDIQGNNVIDIAVTDIDPNPSQPRRTFDEETLSALADSIRGVGVLQPILVRKSGKRYQIIAGERRFRAARIAGYRNVPCIVRDYTREEELEAALIENLQRENLNPIEEAEAVQRLMKECGYTQEAAAQRLGKSRPGVANLLRLLTLPEDIKLLIVEGKLSEGHGRVLAGVDRIAFKRELAEKTVREGLSVRALEKIASEKKEEIKPKAVPPIDPDIKAFEENLHRAFGARSRVQGGLDNGRIIISYRNREELETIYDAVEKLINE